MAAYEYDLVIIGAGSGGLIAAGFAAQLGAKVALVEKDRIGGDCTWTGCMPSKALVKAAKIAHEVRTASQYGINAGMPSANMAAVRDYVRRAIQQVYQHTTPEALQRQGMDVLMGGARFIDRSSILVGHRKVRSKKFLITTGAIPVLPRIDGLNEVPFDTYKSVFETETLPHAMIVVGGGPIGMELAQAYQRLGALVTVIAEHLLPKEDSDVRERMRAIFEREGVRFVWGRAKAVRRLGEEVVISTDREEARGNLLLIASGRKPMLDGLDLRKAGVNYSEEGIPVDDRLRTSAKNIYAAGDVLGGYQFSHFAGWQAFQAVRNALLPGSSSGLTDIVPRVTFTDPEVAHVGHTEREARSKFGDDIQVCRQESRRIDRAVCENDLDGFIKVIAKKDGTILGATIVAQRAGETINELAVAVKHKLKIGDVAGTIHAYPTYSTGVQLLMTSMAVEKLLSGTSGRLIRGVSRFVR